MILVVGLSPACQRVLFFKRLIPGRVNRATRVAEIASGKAVNVARVARQLGARVRLIEPTGVEPRICQTLIANRVVTELVEEAPSVSKTQVRRILQRFDREQRRARLIVLSGSVPPGCGDDFYARLIRRARVPVLVDAHGRQLVNAMKAKPFVVKVNRDEVQRTAGAEWLVISDGAKRVEVRHGRERFVFKPPRVRAVNTIGSGDAMLAGMAVALERGATMPEAIRFGIACGAANALTELPGFVNPADVKRLLRKVK
jgi:tagatose 6-phosphate kinase